MENITKDIYAVMGMIFYEFVNGQSYSLGTLKQYRRLLSDMRSQNKIDSVAYETLIDAIDSVVDFLT